MSIFAVTTSTYVTTRSQKLTPYQRGAIKIARDLGTPCATIAAVFGIAPQTVSKIAQGSWGNGGAGRRDRTPGRVVGVSK